MTTHTPHRQAHRPPPSMVMAAILAIVAGLLGAAGAAQAVPQEPTEPTDPTEKVITISDLVVPVYGDALTFKVKAGGRDNVLYVYDGTEVLVGPVTMGNTAATAVSVPSVNRYRAGVKKTVRVEVLDDIGNFGNVFFDVTAKHIPSRVVLAGTTVPYGSPVYGRLDPTVTTSIVPSGGSMAMRRGTLVRARDIIRTDRTFALNEGGLLPGTYRDVAFFYEGDQSYAANAAGTGMVVTDLVVTKMPTTTTADLSTSTVEQGKVVEVRASTVPSRGDSTGDVTGVVEVHAARAGETAFDKIAEVAYPGGRQQVRVDISAWAAQHPGTWTIRTVNHGTAVADGSADDDTLEVVPPGATVQDTTTALSLSTRTATVRGAPARATATVTAGSSAVGTGSVEFRVDSRVVATVPVGADGRAVAPITAARVGGIPVVATYVGTAAYAGSASPAQTLTGVRATSATTLTLKRKKGRKATLAVAVTAATPVTGIVQVLRGTKVVATGRLVAGQRGRLTLTVRGLRPGKNRLTARYLGSTTVAGSASKVLKVRAAG